MPDIPREAFHAAVSAHECAWVAGASREDLVLATLEAAAPGIAAQARADERRQVAREIAKEILRQKPAGGTQLTWDGGLRRAARVARQIGEAQ